MPGWQTPSRQQPAQLPGWQAGAAELLCAAAELLFCANEDDALEDELATVDDDEPAPLPDAACELEDTAVPDEPPPPDEDELEEDDDEDEEDDEEDEDDDEEEEPAPPLHAAINKTQASEV